MNLEADICNNWNKYKKMSLVLVVGSSEEEKITIVQLWGGLIGKIPKESFFAFTSIV